MSLPRLAPALLALMGLACQAGATDLTKVPRTIAKEPAYESKSPYYCLLVFGPEAKSRVWLVLDGDTLYIDRNGNGDLTEEGEKVDLPEFTKMEQAFMTGQRMHSAGAITAWPDRDMELTLMQMRLRPDYKTKSAEEAAMLKLVGNPPGGVMTGLMVMDRAKGKDGKAIPSPESNPQMAMADSEGALRFTDRPAEAPIVHFRGPLRMGLHPMQKLVRGRESDLKAGIGTPGLGKGTFVMVLYQGLIPEDVHPVAEVELPPAGPGKTAVKTTATLNQRC